jgi:uncharacterized protein (DUF302 family)
MAGELATTTYSVSEPFEQAVRSLRKVLAGGNLQITGELDMSGRIRQRLLISTAPCRVLFVNARVSVFENREPDSYTAALTPLHIVVSARGSQTEIHLLRASPADNGALDLVTTAAFQRLQTETAQAIEKIGMRPTLGA